MPKLLRSLLLVVLFVWMGLNGLSHAATIEIRPDLIERISSLSPLYPPQSAASVLGAEPGEWIEPYARTSRCNGDSGCDVIKISGVIEPGDAAKLAAILEDWSTFHLGIVFESPGGNFLEGLRLAKTIRTAWAGNESNLGGVYVLNGGDCLSACALAFAGSVDLNHDLNDVRYIQNGAKIGFHMGILPEAIAERSVKAGDMLLTAYDIVAEYTDLIAGNRNPPALLQEALKHRTPDSFYFVEADILGWAMGFTPVSSGVLASNMGPSSIDFGLANAICNHLLSYGRIYKSAGEMEFGQFYAYGTPSPEDIAWLATKVEPGIPMYAAPALDQLFSCQFLVDQQNNAGAVVWRDDQGCAAGINKAEIVQCLAKHRSNSEISTAMLADVLGCPGGVFTPAGQNHFSGEQRTGIIKRDVNVRQLPNLEAGIVVQIASGENVQLLDCKIVDDSQKVWFQIKTGSATGWASGRFIAIDRAMPHSPLYSYAALQ